MKSIYSIVGKLALRLPSDCIRMAANNIEKGMGYGDVSLVWGLEASKLSLISEFYKAAAHDGVTSETIVSALRAAADTADCIRAENSVDILWTGPKSSSVPIRRMEQSLCELIESAEKRLVIVSFVAYKADKVYKAIRGAIERGVCVSFLTESSKEYGGSLDVDPSEILRKRFPEADFYRWENPDFSSPAVVHAKCAVADDKMALVTSANLTEAAMDNNMELGLLLKGQSVAARLAMHFEALIVEGIIKKI